MEFNWTSSLAPSPAAPEPVSVAPVVLAETPKSATTSLLGSRSVPALRPQKRMRTLLCDLVERLLRERNLPYVRVDEAKKALFSTAKLSAFHLVVYQKQSPNWLVWAAKMHPGVKKDMDDWEKVFGEGFKAVLAKKRANGSIAFSSLDGKEVELK
jgi:hypothetical protein